MCSERARAILGDMVFEEAWERGRRMAFEQAAAYALSETDAPEGAKTL